MIMLGTDIADENQDSSKKDENQQTRDDLMFSLESRVLVVKLVDVKDQITKKGVKIVTDFEDESCDRSKENENDKSMKRHQVNIGTNKEFCEVCKMVSSNTVVQLCDLSPRGVKEDVIVTKTNNKIDSDRTNVHLDLFAKGELYIPETKQIGRELKRLGSSKKLVCVKCNKVLFTQRKDQPVFHNETNEADHEKLDSRKSTCEISVKHNLATSPAHERRLFPKSKNTTQFVCKICDKRFSLKRHLKTHQITHSDQKNFKCGLCEKSYKHSTSLEEHKKTEHAVALGLERKVYVCKHCGKHFLTKYSLKMHMIKHDNVKHHVCRICEKSFMYKSSLINHVQLHSEDRPFACALCSSTFKIKKDLIRHQVKHSESLNYSCNECGKKFKYRSKLNDHVWSHKNPNNFVCDTCGFSCDSKSSFTSHKRTHDHSQTFPCNLCGKEFFHDRLLKKHTELVHSTETFQCNHCGKKFSAKQYLQNHMKTHFQVTFSCVCGKTYRSKIGLQNHMVMTKH